MLIQEGYAERQEAESWQSHKNQKTLESTSMKSKKGCNPGPFHSEESYVTHMKQTSYYVYDKTVTF